MQINPFSVIIACIMFAIVTAIIQEFRHRRKYRDAMGPISAATLLEYFGGVEARGVYFTFLGWVDNNILHISVDHSTGRKILFLKKEQIVNIKMFEPQAKDLFYLTNEKSLQRVMGGNP